MADALGWNSMEHCEGTGVLRHVDECECPEHDPVDPGGYPQTEAAFARSMESFNREVGT